MYTQQKGGEHIMTRDMMRFSPASDIDRFFGEAFLPFVAQGYTPAVDMYQDNDNLIVEMSLPGINADDVDVSVENDVLTISGETHDKSEVKRENYYRKEMRCGAFSRSVILPFAVKGDKASADYEKGVLRVTLPKAEEAKQKKITVNLTGK